MKKRVFLNNKYSQRQRVSSLSAQCLCHLYLIIKWSTLDGGCTVFSCVLKPKIKKMGTLKKNGDPESEKGPHGDPGPQMGTHVGAVPNIPHGCSSSPRRKMLRSTHPCFVDNGHQTSRSSIGKKEIIKSRIGKKLDFQKLDVWFFVYRKQHCE